MNELQIRNNTISKARSLYIPSVTTNISVALELFLKNNATEDEKVPLVISRENRPANWVDKIGRPKCLKCDRDMLLNITKGLWQCEICGTLMDIATKHCPECNESMTIAPVNVSRCTMVDSKYNSVWTCRNDKCMETIYNKETIQDILMEGR